LKYNYDYGFRIYDTRVARFLSLDPLFKSYPFYTPYQFAGNNPIKFIDLDGLERQIPQGHTGVPLLDNYYKEHGAVDIDNPNRSYGNKKKGDLTGAGYNEDFNPLLSKKKPSFGGDKEDLTNPLDYGVDRTMDKAVFGRENMTPTYKEGTITTTFTPATDEKGKAKVSTYELGVVDADGKETSLVKTTTDKPGSITTNFKLNKGEQLYQRSSNGVNTNTTATKVAESNSDVPADDTGE